MPINRLIVDVYDVVPWQSPGGTTFHDVDGAKLSWLAVCILAVVKPRLRMMMKASSEVTKGVCSMVEKWNYGNLEKF